MQNKIASAKVYWGDMYLTLTGIEDFDQYVFQKLESGEINSNQATNLWHYTDGYRLNIESTVLDGTYESIHCLKKTRSVIRDDDYDSGSICFETVFGSIIKLGFYGNIDTTTTAITYTDNKWWSETIGYSDATATTASAA